MSMAIRHVVITGASSGIGAALALHYAAQGCFLSLTGRDEARLAAVAQDCVALGAGNVQMQLIDVRDQGAMQAWLVSIDAQRSADLVIANAGIGAGTGARQNGESPEQVQAVFAVNWQGVLNTINPLLPRMIARGHGHVALMSSLAAFRGWPGAPSYCASKAAVKIYGEGLRGALQDTGVKVHVICPGFVKSRMTDSNNFPMPLLITADRAAQIIARGIEKNRGRIAFPFVTTSFAWLFGAMPDGLATLILKSMPKKNTL
jgi:short-subunit dehydrogenase